MVKFGCGVMTLGFAASLIAWLGYNLLVARQREFSTSICGFGFIAALLFVGCKWAWEGWPVVSEMFRPKRRKKKKKKRRPVIRDEEDDE